jgi:predicted nucleic acid-binding protein
VTLCFDTNVFGYAIDATAGRRHATAVDLVERALGSGETVLILQTLAEFYTMVTRKLETSPDDACSFLVGLRAALPVYSATEPDLDKAMAGTQRHGLSFWDAMLWATADRIGVRYLLTEDFQDGRVLGGVTFVNPFEGRNEALLAAILPLS